MGCANLADHQSGPRKRQKVSNGLDDSEEEVGKESLSDFDLYQARLSCVKQLQSNFEDIIQRYEKEFPDDDEIDLRTGRITVNNGHLDKLQEAIRESDDSDDEEDDDAHDDQSINEALALARKKGIPQLPPATDPLWRAPDFPKVSNHSIGDAHQQINGPSSNTPSQAMLEFERRRKHHVIRRGRIGRGVFRRTRNNLTPAEIHLLVTLKQKNATWGEVDSLLPHRQHEMIRQWYRNLKVNPNTPENWTDECQNSMNELVSSTPDISWGDLFAKFNGFSRRKLKHLWLKTCIACAGLQPSPNWKYLTEYGPGDKPSDASSESLNTCPALNDAVEVPPTPISPEISGQAKSPDSESPEPESSPDPHDDADTGSAQPYISIAPFHHGVDADDGADDGPDDDGAVWPSSGDDLQKERLQSNITNKATSPTGTLNETKLLGPEEPQRGRPHRHSISRKSDEISPSLQDTNSPRNNEDDDTHIVSKPVAVTTTPVSETVAESKQFRRSDRPKKHPTEQQPSIVIQQQASTPAVQNITPAKPNSAKSTPLSSVGTRKSSRRTSMPSSTPRETHSEIRKQATKASAARTARTAKAPQPQTPKTPSHVQDESDSDDPLSTPFTTVRPVSRRLVTHAESPLDALSHKLPAKRAKGRGQ